MPSRHTVCLRYLLPYQNRWFYDKCPISYAEKSRRIGWTYASAARAVDRRLRLGTDLFYTSADLTAADEFMECCRYFARLFDALVPEIDESILDDTGSTTLVMRFANGARIVAGSSNPKFFRSKGGDADADEFAFHQDPRELYKAMQPTALMWGHQLRVWSTHNGAGSFFHRLVQPLLNFAPAPQPDDDLPDADEPAPADVPADVASATVTPRIRRRRVTLHDAVKEGLVEKIRGLKVVDDTVRQDFIEEIRASCPDEASFREEYCCEPSAEGSALLGYATITACEAANIQLLDVDNIAGDAAVSKAGAAAPAPLFAGFDVGRKRDRSVLWVVERIGDVLWTRVLRVIADTDYTHQEQLLDRLMQARRVRRLCIDSTGLGGMLAERLSQRYRGRVEEITFTADIKNDLAMPLVRLFQERLVRIPADAAIREDLHKVRRTVTAAHHIRLSAPRDADGHSDRFWALALAAHAAEQSPAQPGASAARKPVGW